MGSWLWVVGSSFTTAGLWDTRGAKFRPVFVMTQFKDGGFVQKQSWTHSALCVVDSAANSAPSSPNAARQRSRSSTARSEGAPPSNTGPPCRGKAWWSCWTRWAQRRVSLSVCARKRVVFLFLFFRPLRFLQLKAFECHGEIVRGRQSDASPAFTTPADSEQLILSDRTRETVKLVQCDPHHRLEPRQVLPCLMQNVVLWKIQTHGDRL